MQCTCTHTLALNYANTQMHTHIHLRTYHTYNWKISLSNPPPNTHIHNIIQYLLVIIMKTCTQCSLVIIMRPYKLLHTLETAQITYTHYVLKFDLRTLGQGRRRHYGRYGHGRTGFESLHPPSTDGYTYRNRNPLPLWRLEFEVHGIPS